MLVRVDMCTGILLREIANPYGTRRMVVEHYAFAIRRGSCTDWERVNRAIMDRWSEHALVWIKRRAWRLAREEA